MILKEPKTKNQEPRLNQCNTINAEYFYEQ